MTTDVVYAEPHFYRDENYDPNDPFNAPSIRDDADVVVKRHGKFGMVINTLQITRPDRCRIRVYDGKKMTNASRDRICNLLYGRHCEMHTMFRSPTTNKVVDYFGFH